MTHDEDSELRDPERGTRPDGNEIVRPEHADGIRPMPGENYDPAQEQVAGEKN